ncbi:hypothetical protein MPER_05309, partial [Moniliophthora perniciosa FA553]
MDSDTLQIYDVETRQFPAWSRELSNHLPRRFTTIHDALLGVAFAPVVSQSSSRLVIFWVPIPHANVVEESTKEPSAVKDDSPHWEHKVKVITQYRPLLLVDFVGEGELIVVERPL